MFDRNKPEQLEVRVGDTLVIYNTRSIPVELQPEIVYQISEYASRQSEQKAKNTLG